MRSLMADTIAYSDRPRGLELGSLDEFLGWLQEWATGMSDARVSEPDYLEAGEYSVCRFMGRGTNDGPMGPGKAAVFILVHQCLWGVYMGCSFAPNHKGMPTLKR